MDQLNYFKLLIFGENWLILDNFNKKGKILQLFLSAQSGLARNKRPFHQCLLTHISTFCVTQMQIGHKFEPEMFGSISGFPSSSALLEHSPVPAEMLILLLSSKRSCHSSPLLLHCPSKLLPQWCWDEVDLLKVVRIRGVLRR